MAVKRSQMNITCGAIWFVKYGPVPGSTLPDWMDTLPLPVPSYQLKGAETQWAELSQSLVGCLPQLSDPVF